MRPVVEAAAFGGSYRWGQGWEQTARSMLVSQANGIKIRQNLLPDAVRPGAPATLALARHRQRWPALRRELVITGSIHLENFGKALERCAWSNLQRQAGHARSASRCSGAAGFQGIGRGITHGKSLEKIFKQRQSQWAQTKLARTSQRQRASAAAAQPVSGPLEERKRLREAIKASQRFLPFVARCTSLKLLRSPPPAQIELLDDPRCWPDRWRSRPCTMRPLST